MAKPKVDAGGGLAALKYTLQKGREAGGVAKLYRRLRSRNACKTCAFGMGGQSGGMVNEAGHFPEVCKKSIQAQAGDMARPITEQWFRDHDFDAMSKLSSFEFEKLGRLAFPVIADPGADRFRRVAWDEALDISGRAFADSPPDETFFYASGRASNEAAFLLQLVARAYGTNNVNNCSYYCHQASGVALAKVYGSGTASVTLDDLDRADLAVVVGANPASNHPRLITKLVELRERGGKVLVINPLRELGLERFRVPSRPKSMLFGSQISDLYLQPHIGGDLALFLAFLKGLVESSKVDESFVAKHTTGWPALCEQVRNLSWSDLEAESGVPMADLDAAIAMIAKAGRGIFMWAMGLTHHENGVDNILALANVALARGWLGFKGRGLMPIRGHSNVQGVGSCGVTPALKDAFAKRLEELYQLSLPTAPGLDTYASMARAAEGKINAAFLLGGNLYASNPDSRWAAAAMRKIPMTVSVTTKLNEGHVHGRGQTSLILPALARDEESQATTQESMFNFVRLSDGGVPAVEGEMRSEVEIIAELAGRVLDRASFNWSALRSHSSLRSAIAECVPGYAPLSDIESTKREFQIEGRTFHSPSFATADDKAVFHLTPFRQSDRSDDRFKLMTIRSEGQFNTVVYEEEDLYRGVSRRDAVLMSAADAQRLGVDDGDSVSVASDLGSMTAIVAVVNIRRGNVAMYYPEANVIVPRVLDPASKTPAFKSIDVRISSMQS